MNLKVLENKQPVRDLYHLSHPDKHVLISTTPIYNENNELIGSMSVEKDIIATIKLNDKLSSTSEELQKLKQQIIQNNGDKHLKNKRKNYRRNESDIRRYGGKRNISI